MDKYYYLLVELPLELEGKVQKLAFSEDFGCQGIEEFSIDEPKVDKILGDRSYSGGDLPESVIGEVEEVLRAESSFKKLFFENQEKSLLFKQKLQDEFSIESNLESAEVQDWDEEWKKSYKAIFIDEELQIIPAWEKAGLTKGHVYIYPGMGFGTGGHETTFLCLKLYSQIKDKIINKNNFSCLDFGCGSGILGIAVRYHFKAVIDLYDIDEAALNNCTQNIELNEMVSSDFKLLLPKQRDQINKQYEIVFANILQNVLLEEAKFLTKSLLAGGFLILSGLLRGQEKEVIEKYQSLNKDLSLVEVVVKGDWVAILMEQK